MWMFGIITNKEAKMLKKAGYKVKKYSESAFNKFIEPNQKFKEFKSDKDVSFYGVWIDSDMYENLEAVINLENNKKEYDKQNKLTEDTGRNWVMY